MNVVDSSAWLEYFADGSNAKHYLPIVKITDRLVVPVLILYEVFKVVMREKGEHAALQVCGAMLKGTVVDVSSTLAVAAAKLSLNHDLPMADAIILATTRECGATLWTQDAHFKNIEGVRYFPKK